MEMTSSILDKTELCGEVYSRLTAKCGISMRLEEEVTQDGYRLAAENTIALGREDWQPVRSALMDRIVSLKQRVS